MIRTTMDLVAHPQDGDLLRYLDGECDAVERAGIREHLESCSRCASALGELKSSSDRLEGLLPLLYATPRETAKEELFAAVTPRSLERPARPSTIGLLARAAVIALAILGVGLTVTPVRAWLIERVAAVRTALFAGGDVPVVEVESQAADQAPPTVSFEPASGAFFIEIAAQQPSGTLRLTIERGDLARAQMRGKVASEGFTVLPNGLRISNATTSAADYHVTLPVKLSEITLRIGGQDALTVSTDGLELPATWSYSLSR